MDYGQCFVIRATFARQTLTAPRHCTGATVPLERQKLKWSMVFAVSTPELRKNWKLRDLSIKCLIHTLIFYYLVENEDVTIFMSRSSTGRTNIFQNSFDRLKKGRDLRFLANPGKK